MIFFVNLPRRHMKSKCTSRIFALAALIFVAFFFILTAQAQQSKEGSSSQVTGTSSLPASDMTQPDAFAASLKTAAGSGPLIEAGRLCS
jgi:hypothetical protein